MLRSRNVTLRRSSDAALRRIHDGYESEDNAETQLEDFVLGGERRANGHAAVLIESADTSRRWTALMRLLADLSAYGALGAMGGADQRFCQRLQPLLTRLMKAALNGGFEVVRGSGETAEEEDMVECPVDVEELLQAASKALSNCSEGVARRCADTTLEVQLGPPSDTLRVCFGFADYTSGETGAMLWAGAVGLSLYLIENYETIFAEKAREAVATTRQPLRVLELGCGPALVSLVLASMAARAAPATAVPCQLSVTDVSATVVDEARRSFRARNGPALTRMLVADSEDGSDADGDVPASSSLAGFRVHPFVLDFSDIPPHLCGAYDLVVASDVVYDHDIAAHVAPALEALLKPGGVAFLCCEAHRDGMAYFTSRIRAGQANASHLRVAEEVRDVQTVLTRLQMLSSLTTSTCSLMRVERTAS